MLALTLIFIPLVSSLLLFGLKKSSAGLVKNIALVSSIATFLVALTAFFTFHSNTTEEVKFVWMKGLNINFQLSLDGISLVMVLLTSFLTPLIILSTFKQEYKNSYSFYGLILLTSAALSGVFLARDIFLFYFFFEAALVPVYFIAALWGGSNAPKITFKMFAYTIFGSLFMLVSIVFLYSKGVSADLVQLNNTAKLLSPSTQGYLFAGFFVAFAIKMPLFPFHTWQPDAYTESPTPATMLLSGLLSKMGVYGLIRIALPLSPLGLAGHATFAMVLSVVGLVYGSIIAVQQNNIKRLIAYSSFAHMGLMAAGVFSASQEGIQGAVFQMLAHGVNAVGLFYVVKIIFDRTGTRELHSLGGITQKAPKLTIFFMVIMLGSVALPLTNGFVGEFLLLKAVYDKNMWLGGIAGLTIIFGAVYMLRLMQRSMFGTLSASTENFDDISGSEVAVLLPIVIVVLLMGIFPNLFLKITEPAVSALLQSIK